MPASTRIYVSGAFALPEGLSWKGPRNHTGESRAIARVDVSSLIRIGTRGFILAVNWLLGSAQMLKP